MDMAPDVKPEVLPSHHSHWAERLLWYWVLGALYLVYRNVAVPLLRDWQGSGSDSQYIPVLFVWLCFPEGLVQRSLKVGIANMGISFLGFIMAYFAAGVFSIDKDMALIAGISLVGACTGLVSTWHTHTLLTILLGFLFGQLAVVISSALGLTGYGLLSMRISWPDNLFEVFVLSTLLPISQSGAILLAARWNSKAKTLLK